MEQIFHEFSKVLHHKMSHKLHKHVSGFIFKSQYSISRPTTNDKSHFNTLLQTANLNALLNIFVTFCSTNYAGNASSLSNSLSISFNTRNTIRITQVNNRKRSFFIFLPFRVLVEFQVVIQTLTTAY